MRGVSDLASVCSEDIAQRIALPKAGSSRGVLVRIATGEVEGRAWRAAMCKGELGLRRFGWRMRITSLAANKLSAVSRQSAEWIGSEGSRGGRGGKGGIGSRGAEGKNQRSFNRKAASKANKRRTETCGISIPDLAAKSRLNGESWQKCRDS